MRKTNFLTNHHQPRNIEVGCRPQVTTEKTDHWEVWRLRLRSAKSCRVDPSQTLAIGITTFGHFVCRFFTFRRITYRVGNVVPLSFNRQILITCQKRDEHQSRSVRHCGQLTDHRRRSRFQYVSRIHHIVGNCSFPSLDCQWSRRNARFLAWSR